MIIKTVLISLISIVLIGCQNKEATIEYIYNSKRVIGEINSKNISKVYNSNKPKELQFKYPKDSIYIIKLYENGLKESEGKMIGGVREGLWKNYYQNGTPKNHLVFKNNKINGRVFEIDSLGSVMFVGNQKMGKLDGFATYFYEDGSIRKQGKYESGVQVGEWIRND